MTKIFSRFIKFLSSRLFFRLSLVWFSLQASWIALSGLYPMAFDERYHFEVIKIYANRLHPFWLSMTGDAPYGALSRDPSYMYHYLLSFPYRLLEWIVPSEQTQVIVLRFSSIGLFVAGIIVFKKVLTNAGLSKALSNLVIAMVAATPIVSQLAGQINYDNLFFLVFAFTLLQLQKVLNAIKTDALDLTQLYKLVLICMFGSLVKYAFLPVLLGIIGVLINSFFKHHRPSNTWKATKSTAVNIRKEFGSKTAKAKLLLIVPFFIFFGLCFERYGVNLVRYNTPVPDCDQVLTVDQCYANPPWRRNYITRWAKENGKLDEIKDTNFIKFAFKAWPEKTTYHLFYAIDGEKTTYLIRPPIKIARDASLIVLISGGILFLLMRRRIGKKYVLNSLLFVMLVYVSSLLLQNYSDFVYLGYPFGIQGRYLIPILPVLYAGVVVAFNTALGIRRSLKAGIAALAIVFIVTQGGGAATYIIRSDDQWLWPNQIVRSSNHYVRTILRPFVIDSQSPRM